MRSVSIVIPCRNEEKYIGKCIESVLAQDYPGDLISLFVCDGKSTDATQAIVKDYAAKNGRVHLLINEKQTTPFALNLGINASASDVFIILGAHSELHPAYVSACMEAFKFGDGIACVGGIIENVYENQTSEVIGKAMSSAFGVGNAHFRTGNKDGYVDTVAFGAYRREMIAHLGLFDEELIRNQDDEFNYRLIKNGFKIYLYRKIRSDYYVRASFKKLFKQYEQYGYWKVYVNKKHRAVTTVRQLVPLFFVLFLISGICLSFVHPLFLMFFIAILSVYLCAAGVFALMKAKGVTQFFLVGWSFFILHLSYGWGYLKGIVDFFVLGKKIKIAEALTR